MIYPEEYKAAAAILQRTIETIEDLGAKGKDAEFQALTGLNGRLVPSIVAIIAASRNLPEMEEANTFALFDALMVGVALGYGQGLQKGEGKHD
jgi:hypothetical protein